MLDLSHFENLTGKNLLLTFLTYERALRIVEKM